MAGERRFRWPWRSGRRIEQEVDEEIRFHLEMRAEELARAGMSESDAAVRARAEFGDVEGARRELARADGGGERRRRRQEWVRGAARDLQIAARRLIRSPAHTGAAVVTLALGIGATTAVFGVVDAVLLRPLPYPAPDRLVQVWGTSPDTDSRSASPANFLDWREQSREFESLSAYDVRAGNLLGGEAAERVTYATVSSSFFGTLGVQPILGGGFVEGEPATAQSSSVVLSHAFWRTRFGADPSVVGRTLSLDGQSLRVAGVAAPDFDFPGGMDMWTRAPWDVPEVRSLPPDVDIREVRDSWYFLVVGRLAAGRTVEQAQAEMELIAGRLREAYPEANRDAGIRLVSLRESLVGSSRPTLLMLLAAVGLVLLIACTNVAHLVLLRTAEQERELAVRAALGAGRGRLARHLFLESLLLGVAGGAAGVGLAYLASRGLGAVIPPDVLAAGEAGLDRSVLFFAAGLSVATALIFGGLPALLASRVDLRARLGSRGGGVGRGERRVRTGVIVAEVTLAVVLVSSAILTIQSLWRLQSVDPGFATDELVQGRLSIPGGWRLEPGAAAATYLAITERIGNVPGVAAAAVALAGPADTGPGAGLRIEGRANDDGALPGIEWQPISNDYFGAAGIPLLRGRPFAPSDDAGSVPVAIVNETAARAFFPGDDPLGRRINTGLDGRDVWVTIVGVAADTRNEGLAADPAPEMYRPLSQPSRFGGEEMALLVRSAREPGVLVAELRSAVSAAGGEIPLYDIQSGGQLLYGSTATPRFVLYLLGAFALLALALGAVGIYGVTAYGVRHRHREIGLRLALGAEPRELFAMVLRGGMARVGVGIVLGLGLSLAANRVLRQMLYGIGAVEPLALAGVAAILLGVALAAIAMPARRTTRLDPAEALRAD